MCGICGYWNDDGSAVDRARLEAMAARLRHRGPDSEGYFIADDVGMGVRRLSVIDIKGGDQPIFSEDESIALTFNGEIYNFADLRAELCQHGYRFRTQSDGEVIVHAYEQWGDDALLRFDGMFAIALWDRRKQRLLLARDFMGEKPLYWQRSAIGIVWASEARALLALPWVGAKVDRLALHHYLTLRYIPDPWTIYDGIRRLPAAHKLVVERGREPRIERYWQPSFEPKWDISEHQAIAEARVRLRAAVTRRLVSDVPLGVFLSGGIDSSVVVALMAQASSRPVKTFSIGFEERHYSETAYSRRIAKHFGTDHYEYTFRLGDFAALVEHAVDAGGEPLADSAMLPLYELARQARSHITVALCGDGGDETMAGYRRYAADSLLRPYAKLPAAITRCLVPALARRLPEANWIPEGRNPFAALNRLGAWAATTPKASMVRWDSSLSHEEKLELYTDSCRQSLAEIDTATWLSETYDDAPADSALDRTLYVDQMTYLPGDLLCKTDRATMAHSLEARSPFLDHNWVAWSARLPQHFKVRGWRTKWLLKHAFADLLPPGIAWRAKQGFAVPLAAWLRTPRLRPWMRERLLENRRLDDYFRPRAVRQRLDEHDSAKSDSANVLWTLLVFSLWLDRTRPAA